MATVPWVRHALTEHQAPFQELHHGRAATAQKLAELEHVSGHTVAKAVVVMVDGQPVQTVLPASRFVDMKRLKQTLRAQNCRLATEAEIAERFTDCELGAMPPMRRWPGVEVVMDESLRTNGDIIFPAGTQNDAIRMRFNDWMHLVDPRTGVFSRAFGRSEREGRRDDFVDWEY